MMRTLYLLVLALFLGTALPAPAGAQNQAPPHKEHWEAIKARKVAFFSDFVGFTPAEAEKFWPVYKQFERDIREVMYERGRALRTLRESERDNKKLTEEDAQRATHLYLGTYAKEGKLRESLTKQLAPLISQAKILKVFAAEEEFNNRLMREWAVERQAAKQPRN